MAIESNVTKELILRNEIIVDGKVVKGQTATINSKTNKISFSDWTNDMEAYKTNRAEIRKMEAEFEDAAFIEQEKMATAVAAGGTE